MQTTVINKSDKKVAGLENKTAFIMFIREASTMTMYTLWACVEC